VVRDHPITRGVDRFTVTDEAYGHMWVVPDMEPLAVASWGGEDHPMLWVRRVGDGLVVTSTLGHGPESFGEPSHERLLRQSIAVLADSAAEVGS
jgi:type 1 glutamine amidotransferase